MIKVPSFFLAKLLPDGKVCRCSHTVGIVYNKKSLYLNTTIIPGLLPDVGWVGAPSTTSATSSPEEDLESREIQP